MQKKRMMAVWGVALALVVLQAFTDKPDPRPASFFGTGTVDGNPVADGTRVSARGWR